MSKDKLPRHATEQQSADISEISEAQIAVHWPEEGYFSPSNPFIAQANLTDAGIFTRFALDKFPECFKEFADLLDWYKYWETTLDTSNPRSGAGSSAARSTLATTAWTDTLASTRTRRRSISCPSRRTRRHSTSPTRSFSCASTSSRPCCVTSAA